jgi:phage recombination protein Bet
VSNSQLAVLPSAQPVVLTDDWSDERIEFVRRNYCGNAPDAIVDAFVRIARRRGLSPEERQIYLVPRKSGGQVNWVIQTGIDGYRLIAERTGAYAGSDDPVFEESGLTTNGNKPYPSKATVTVWKLVQGIRCPFTMTVHWEEYNAGVNQWLTMPHTMLAKCFSDDTEVLTDRGFQRFSDVTGHILHVTDTGLAPTNAVPFVQAWHGNMVTLDSDDLNFSVTPNHDMVTTEGKIEAGALFARARTRPNSWIPRCVSGTIPDSAMSDQGVRIAAAYLADGTDQRSDRFAVEVSRERKVEQLREIGGFISETERKTAGAIGRSAIRTITTRLDKRRFIYDHDEIGYLCERGKRIRLDHLLTLSRRQARLFVDTLLSFDGHTNKRTGVRRFYTSRIDHIEAFEVACVQAGYAVSPRSERMTDISSKPNYSVTVSGRSEIPVVRWGRDYHSLSTGNARRRTGLVVSQNESGKVWCVTVPSGVIVVRRHGFSMLCGNCGESVALRKAFPADLNNIYTAEEMDQAGAALDGDTVTVRDVTERRQNAPAPKALPAQGQETAKRSAPPQTSTAPSKPATPMQRLHGHANGRKLTHDDVHALALLWHGKRSTTELTPAEIAGMIAAFDPASGQNLDDETLATEVVNAYAAVDALKAAVPVPGSPEDLSTINAIVATPSTANDPEAERRERAEEEKNTWTIMWRFARENGLKTTQDIERFLGHAIKEMQPQLVHAELKSRIEQGV